MTVGQHSNEFTDRFLHLANTFFLGISGILVFGTQNLAKIVNVNT